MIRSFTSIENLADALESEELPQIDQFNRPTFPMHQAAGDSCVMLIPVSRDFEPGGLTTTPGEQSIKMPRAIANEMAVKLNRDVLRRSPHCPHWNVVTYSPSGFHVLRIQPPEDWQSETEYDMPPVQSSRLMNCEARRELKSVNGAFVKSGRKIKHWAIHVKRLRKIDDADTTMVEEEPMERLEVHHLQPCEYEFCIEGDDVLTFRVNVDNIRFGQATREECQEYLEEFLNSRRS